MAEFLTNGTIKAKLSTGEEVLCSTKLKAYGEYREWWEPAPVEWGYSYKECEQEIDEDTIEPMYPDEFEVKGNNNFDYNDKKIVKILEILNVDYWEVKEE